MLNHILPALLKFFMFVNALIIWKYAFYNSFFLFARCFWKQRRSSCLNNYAFLKDHAIRKAAIVCYMCHSGGLSIFHVSKRTEEKSKNKHTHCSMKY